MKIKDYRYLELFYLKFFVKYKNYKYCRVFDVDKVPDFILELEVLTYEYFPDNGFIEVEVDLNELILKCYLLPHFHDFELLDIILNDLIEYLIDKDC